MSLPISIEVTDMSDQYHLVTVEAFGTMYVDAKILSAVLDTVKYE